MYSKDQFDVAIIGGGLASNAFARHLKLQMPSLDIVILGSKEVPKFTVGESVTELGSNYLQHRLQLTSYLYRNQLFKNGIRLFFDNEDANSPIESMSEEGGGPASNINTFHVDRYYLEKDLQKMNEEGGIVFIETKVADVLFLEDPGMVNSIITAQQTIRARWVVDATGRARLLAKKLQLEKEVPNNFHCSAWCHFKSKNRIDVISDDWRRKNQLTTREFSTIHFVYMHYWFWVIPLRDDIISCGVVYDDRFLFEKGPPSKQELVSFIKKHKALDGLFDKTDILNYKCATRYAYSSKEFINGSKRYILLGDAGAFVDPLYSSGIDVLAQESSFFSEIIIKDITKEVVGKEYEDLVRKANILSERAYHHYSSLVLGNNICMGSCEIFGLKYFFEFFVYFIFKLWPYLSRKSISEQYSHDDETQLVIEFITKNFVMLAQKYRKEGLYHRKNARWRQGALRGIYTRFLTTAKLNQKLNAERTYVFQDLAQFMLLAQAQLYLKRSDLLGDPLIRRFLDFEKIVECARLNIDTASFFKNMHDEVARSELKGSAFWESWIERMHQGLDSVSGHNFEKIKEGIPFFEEPPHDVPRYETGINSVVRAIKEARNNPYRTLEGGLQREHFLLPFVVEGIASGLTARGVALSEVLAKTGKQAGDKFRPMILAGIGMGLHDLSKKADLCDLSDGDIGWILNGYGFQMGLARFFSGKEIYYPGASRRKDLIRGLGRSVTFIPSEANTKEKYDKYFNYFELFLEDLPDFYYGAGFSLAFSKAPVELAAFLHEYTHSFRSVPGSFEEGIFDAIRFKAELLPEMLLPITLSILPKTKKHPIGALS